MAALLYTHMVSPWPGLRHPKYIPNVKRAGLKPASRANGAASKMAPIGHKNTCSGRETRMSPRMIALHSGTRCSDTTLQQHAIARRQTPQLQKRAQPPTRKHTHQSQRSKRQAIATAASKLCICRCTEQRTAPHLCPLQERQCAVAQEGEVVVMRQRCSVQRNGRKAR